MNKRILLGALVSCLMLMLLPSVSPAVPSYARQVKKPCTACHTIWPNLNQAGRQFKVKAYTDVSEEWEMVTKDNLNLATTFPFSARVIYFPLVRQDNPGTGQGSTEIDAIQLFVASRVYDYAGIFGSAEWSPDDGGFHLPTVKAAFEYPLGEGNTIGFVAFKGLAPSADPFNSLGGRDRELSWGDESKPFVLGAGWTFNFFNESNIGEVVHGYFIGNRLYAAVGVMRGGNSDDAINSVGQTNSGGFDPAGGGFSTPTDVNTTDPNDWYYRLAWDQKLPNGAVTLGVAYYDGTQRVLFDSTTAQLAAPYDAKVKRNYIDLSLEQNYGEDHMVEVQALYGSGKETNVFGGQSGADEGRKFTGSYVQADYFYDRKVGLVASLNNIKFKDVTATDPVTTDKINSWLIAVDFLPWLNTKIALQHAIVKTQFLDPTTNPDVTDKITRVVMDMAF
jgi:hypothetical protein